MSFWVAAEEPDIPAVPADAELCSADTAVVEIADGKAEAAAVRADKAAAVFAAVAVVRSAECLKKRCPVFFRSCLRIPSSPQEALRSFCSISPFAPSPLLLNCIYLL